MIGWFCAGELLHAPLESFGSWIGRIEQVTPADEVPRRHADPDRPEQADFAGGSVADAIREARRG